MAGFRPLPSIRRSRFTMGSHILITVPTHCHHPSSSILALISIPVCLYLCFSIQDLNFLSTTVSCNESVTSTSLVCEINSVQNLVSFGFRSSSPEWLLNIARDL